MIEFDHIFTVLLLIIILVLRLIRLSLDFADVAVVCLFDVCLFAWSFLSVFNLLNCEVRKIKINQFTGKVSTKIPLLGKSTTGSN